MGCVEMCGGIGVCVGEICGSSSPGATRASDGRPPPGSVSEPIRSTATLARGTPVDTVTCTCDPPLPFAAARAAIQALAAYRLASIRNRSTTTVSGVALSPIVTMASSMPAIPFSRARA